MSLAIESIIDIMDYEGEEELGPYPLRDLILSEEYLHSFIRLQNRFDRLYRCV